MPDFIHRFVPPEAPGTPGSEYTLLLLHGTGGDENDLLPLGRMLLPQAALLSPRGKILENGAPRFFRRLAEGVFDQEDLAFRSEELAQFIAGAAGEYGFDAQRVIAVGFSNGANIASSVMLRRPRTVSAAVLLSPMLPFEPEKLPDLEGTSVFIGAGRADPIAPVSQVERLADLFRRSGADVTLHWETGGHAVTAGEVKAAQEWIAKRAR